MNRRRPFGCARSDQLCKGSRARLALRLQRDFSKRAGPSAALYRNVLTTFVIRARRPYQHARREAGFAQVFHSRALAVPIPHVFRDCMHAGDIGCGRGSGKAFLRRQGSEIHSTYPLRQMRRQCASHPAVARPGQKGRLRNSCLRVPRVRASDAARREDVAPKAAAAFGGGGVVIQDQAKSAASDLRHLPRRSMCTRLALCTRQSLLRR